MTNVMGKQPAIHEEKVPVETFLPFLSESETRVRLTVLEQLRKRGQQGSKLPVGPLANLLSDPDVRVRWGSIAALDTQEEDVPVDLLIAAMHDANESIIQYATSILGRRRVVDAIPELLEQLLTDPNDFWTDYTDSAVAAIEELYKHVPLERLLNALSSETEKIRFRAITLLSLLKERTPVELLLKLLDDKDPAMRRQVVIALGRHLTRIPIETIVNKLKDRNKEVRKTARLVLLREIRTG